MAKMGSGHGGMAAETKLHQKGMQVRSPSASDASTKCKGGSVNSEPTRKSTAPTPGTLGPREN
jgi:hypothetical protein